ncbi:nitroreductase family protein [bacterium]|nr:nitroreductase family protein [bacterium]
MDNLHTLNMVEATITSRRTSKVLLSVESRHEQQACWTDEHALLLQSMVESARWAPFHKRAHEQHLVADLAGPMPWRFHIVGPEACTRLLEYLKAQADANADPKWGRAWQSKISEMISACGVLIQATWLPEPGESSHAESAGSATEFTQKNIEHVAAASSAIQNLLLAAESHQWLSYWSSGGILRDEEIFDFMGINRTEQLLGSIFLTPEAHPSSRILDGGLRDQRGDMSGWVHWV